MKGLTTGIEMIDKSTRGLKDGELYCFFCPTAEERAVLITQLTIGLATHDNSVLLFSIEKSRRAVFNLLFNSFWKLIDADVQFDVFERRHMVLYKLGELPFWIEYNPNLGYTSLVSTIQRICRLNKYAIESIIIDNIDLMKTDFYVLSKDYAIMANLYLLKMLAKKQNVPVIALCENNNRDLFEQSEYVDKIITLTSSIDTYSAKG